MAILSLLTLVTLPATAAVLESVFARPLAVATSAGAVAPATRVVDVAHVETTRRAVAHLRWSETPS